MLAISMLMFMISFNLFIPGLNKFIETLGGKDIKGITFILFSITAGLSRPIAGKLSDTIGRKPVMYMGIVFVAIICVIYPTIETLFAYVFIRLAHGFGAGFPVTGSTALATDLLPADKRGQGMGIWGVFISLGFGVGFYLGGFLERLIGLDGVFYTASALAIGSGVLLFNVRETLPVAQRQKFHFGLLKLKWIDVIDPSVRPAAIVMFLSASCSGYIFVLTPEIAEFIDPEMNKGTFFLFYSISTIAIRLFTASWSDRIGRRRTLVYAMILLAISMIIIGTANSYTHFAVSALLFGVATGISSPTLMAWMADLSDVDRRGVGAGTLYIALEMGMIVGSGFSLLTYNNTFGSILFSFIVGAVCSLLALIYLIWHIRKIPSVT